jgi:hypothetical protein
MFGYWVYSVTVDEVDQLEFEWQDYDRFKGTVLTLPSVYKVKFPVTEAGKEIRVPTTMDLTNFLQLETSPQQGTNCKESPLMNWWLRNGPSEELGVRCSFKSPNTGWPLPGETYSIRYRLQSNPDEKRLRNNILVEPIDTEQWI